MRKVLMLAVMLLTPAMVPEPAAAGDRGHGFRHSPPHVGAQPHFSQRGKWFDGGHFGQPRHFRPRHFGHHSRGGVVFKFHSGGFGFRHGVVPHFRPPHFGPPYQRPPVLTFGHAPHFRPWGFSRPSHYQYQRSWRGRPHHDW